MTLRVRRIIYFTFIVIFFIIAPFLVLYTYGYRWNFNRGRVQQVGVLMISSDPQGADIYLNNELYLKKTPTRIINLLPENYEVKISKEGYRSWQKKLTIHSAETTFVQDIILFKDKLPYLLSEGKISTAQIIRPDYFTEKIIYLEETAIAQMILMIDPKTAKKTTLYAKQNKNQLTIVDIAYPKILFQEATDFFILDIEQANSLLALKELSQLSWQKLSWDLAGNLLYGLNNENLYKINLTEKSVTKIAENIKSDYLVKANYLYYFSLENEHNFLIQQDILSQNQEKIIGSTLIQPFFRGKNGQILIIQDEKKENILLLDLERKKNILEAQAREINWSIDEQNLAYTNGFELWTFNIFAEKPQLIARYSQEIKNIFWHPKLGHLFYRLGNSFKIIELDSRDGQNIIDLITLEDYAEILRDRRAEKLYFPATINSQQGLYELKIH